MDILRPLTLVLGSRGEGECHSSVLLVVVVVVGNPVVVMEDERESDFGRGEGIRRGRVGILLLSWVG